MRVSGICMNRLTIICEQTELTSAREEGKNKLYRNSRKHKDQENCCPLENFERMLRGKHVREVAESSLAPFHRNVKWREGEFFDS